MSMMKGRDWGYFNVQINKVKKCLSVRIRAYFI